MNRDFGILIYVETFDLIGGTLGGRNYHLWKFNLKFILCSYFTQALKFIDPVFHLGRLFLVTRASYTSIGKMFKI